MYGANEAIYIRQGKATGNIFIGDLTNAGVTIGFGATHTTSLYGVNICMNDDLRTNQLYNRSDTTRSLAFNNGQLSYGTVLAIGLATGWGGYVIYQAPAYATFMGVGNSFGVYNQGAGTWSWQDDGSTFFIGRAATAPSFNATSARAIKRETGQPRRARDILARLRPILYRLLADDRHEQLGLIAEEVHEVCPQLSDGKTVAYDRLALLLLCDWQEARGFA
jgi:hypothetical protein